MPAFCTTLFNQIIAGQLTTDTVELCRQVQVRGGQPESADLGRWIKVRYRLSLKISFLQHVHREIYVMISHHFHTFLSDLVRYRLLQHVFTSFVLSCQEPLVNVILLNHKADLILRNDVRKTGNVLSKFHLITITTLFCDLISVTLNRRFMHR